MTSSPEGKALARAPFLLGFVQAAACSAAEAIAVRQDSAMSEEQWWAANALHGA
jgi:hypothetical protein